MTYKCGVLKPYGHVESQQRKSVAPKEGVWVELGGADEQKSAKEGTVEAWGCSPGNPIGGGYGLNKGLRRRFAVYVPPLLEELGLCELEHN